jgi:hypothetical protein
VEIAVSNPTPAPGPARRPKDQQPPSGAGTAPVRGGHGIVGMRERVTLLGGTLDAGVTQGGFRLHAVLPHGGAPA